MAGTYPDVPGRRFAYDIDGTFIRRIHPNDTYETITGTMASLTNDEDTDIFNDYLGSTGGGAGNYYWVFIFPELRNLDGYFIRISAGLTGNGAQEVQYSTDTIDGSDGTWTTVSNPFINAGGLKPDFRSSITTTALTDIKAVRFGWHWNGDTNFARGNIHWQAVHLYGSISTGQNPDRLRLWHPTLDQEADPAALDFGDITQGAQATKQFRVKNNSASLTANNIDLSTESVSDDMAQGLELSSDGSSYTATLALGTLAPGAVSPVTYLRRTVGATDVATQRAARVKAVAQSWS